MSSSTSVGTVVSEVAGTDDATPSTGRRRRLGLPLAVLATAQLMVVLDGTIVNVALPRIQRALGFSGAGLEWVVNTYTLSFGGLLLLGGRMGDRWGRRNAFIGGLLLFSAASFVGGLATGQASLLVARAVQGAGAALVAPAALALLTTTFAEGPPRNRAMAVYGAISMVGASVGLIGGGVLVRYASWRWVLIVNVPIGIVAAACAARVLPSSQRQRGRLDLPGVITGTVGIASLVYGLSKAAASPNGTPHWGDAHVVTALVATSVLLIVFAVVEMRSRDPLLPGRLLADRNRIGANLILLCGAAAIAGMFFFLTVFMQTVWGYSPLQTGVAYLPLTLGLIASSAAAANLISRLGARPLLLLGTSVSAGSMYWLSRISEHSSYAGAVLGPMLLLAGGMGLLGLPVTLLAMSRVADLDSGIAASVRNTAQQLGASIGLAVLGTVAWTAVADNLGSGTATITTDHRAIATGLAEGLLAAAGIMLLALIVAVVAIRVRRADLDSAEP